MNDREIDYKQFEGERIISVSDLFEEILRKIWLVIILAIAFAVLLAGYKYLSDKSKAENTTGTTSYEKLAASLTDEEMSAVNSILMVYDEVAAADQYMENSIRMNIDPYHENRVLMQLALEAEESNKTEILQVLDNYVNGSLLLTDLQEFYPDVDSTYLAELITFESEAPTLNMSGLEDAVYQSNIFTVRVIHEDADSCQELANAVRQCLTHYVESIAGYFGTCEITLLDEYAFQVYDSSLKSAQNTAVSDLITLQNRITTQTGYLNDKQVEVLEASLSGVELTYSTESAIVPAASTTNVRISRKYTLYGLLIGIAVGFVLIALYYICRGTLNISQELQSVLGISVFGQVHFKKQKNPLVRWWRRVTSKKKAIPLETEESVVLTNLKNYCKNNEVNRILLAGSQVDIADNAWLREVQAALQSEQIETDIAGGLPDSPEALEKVDSYSCVALVETLHTSIYKDVVREAELFKKQNLQVAGAIVLD